MKLEDNTFPIMLEGISKGIESYGFGIVEYYVKSESGCMIELQKYEYYVTSLPKDLCIIYPQFIHTSEGNMGTCIAHCHDEHDCYAEINSNEENQGW